MNRRSWTVIACGVLVLAALARSAEQPPEPKGTPTARQVTVTLTGGSKLTAK